jgi:hypothetical protein
MSAQASGQILFADEGRMHIRIWDGQYYICSKDLGILFFIGGDIPVLKKENGTDTTPMVSGNAYLAPSGQAVIIAIGSLRYMIPRERFLAVAFGEEVSCIFSEMPVDPPGIETLQRGKGGTNR